MYHLLQSGQVYYLVQCGTLEGAIKRLSLIGRHPDSINVMCSYNQLEELRERVFKTGNSVDYWKRHLGTKGYTEVQRYHIH